jgi:hypothetical protein
LLPSTSSTPQDVFYETPKRSSAAAAEIQSDDDDDESPDIEEYVRKFGRENFGKIAIRLQKTLLG